MVQNLCSENLEKVVVSYRRGVLDEKILPPILVIELTNQCNINCIMCPTKYKMNGYMDFKLYTRIINQARSASKTILLYFRGEPLLHPNLIEIVEYAKENTNTRIILSTNATLLTKELSEKIIKSKLDDIVFSIDGDTKYTYEKIKTGADYDKIIKNVHDFIALKNGMKGKINIIIKLIQLGLNEAEIETFERKWKKLGCAVEISWFNTWANQIPDYNNFSDKFNPSLANSRSPCADLWFKCVVTYDGKVVLCCHDFREIKIMGDFKKQELSEIWNSEEIRRLRNTHIKGTFDKIHLCQKCMEWSREDDEYIYFPEFNFKGLGGRP